MGATLTIPTEFVAIDKFTKIVKEMAQSVKTFSDKTQAYVGRMNAKFNKFTGFSTLKDQLFGYVGAAVLAGAIIGGIVFTSRSLLDYEKNVASVHGVLNHLTEDGFKPYQREIDNVAKQMQYSSVLVADSFHKIAELDIDLAKTPGGLGNVAKDAITLAGAANMELTPATESLVSIMRQFHLTADQSGRVSNTMAAGMKYGSAGIIMQTESMANLGPVAFAAHMSLEQTIASLQTLKGAQIGGAEGGTALRSVIIHLQKAHLGYTSGIYDQNDALREANKHYLKYHKAVDADNYLIKLFGIRQINAGRALLSNVDNTAELTKKITGTNQALVQAAINTDTVSGAWERLTAQFINYVTGSDQAKGGMLRIKNAINWVTKNLDTLIDTVITVVKWFVAIKLALWGISAAIKIATFYNTFFATSTVAAATAMQGEAVAAVELESAVGGVAAEMAAAEVAATAFFATLADFVLPAALVALAGYGYFKQVQKGYEMTPDYSKKQYFNKNSAVGQVSPFFDYKEEAGYQDWFVKQAKMGIDRNLLQRSQFDAQFGKDYKPLIDLGAINRNGGSAPALGAPDPRLFNTGPAAKDTSTININLNDPAKAVGSVSASNSSGVQIPVKVTSTQGRR